jgi:hypothetical protein
MVRDRASRRKPPHFSKCRDRCLVEMENSPSSAIALSENNSKLHSEDISLFSIDHYRTPPSFCLRFELSRLYFGDTSHQRIALRAAQPGVVVISIIIHTRSTNEDRGQFHPPPFWIKSHLTCPIPFIAGILAIISHTILPSLSLRDSVVLGQS